MFVGLKHSSDCIETIGPNCVFLPRISLQALDAFERVARSGSVQIAAAEMKLSISSVSHHLARLEEQLGVTLFDRSSRPFSLTREGHQALQHLAKALLHIRRATDDTAISGLLGTRSLRIGIVEEFESSVTPVLAVYLTQQMPRATLSICNVLSHQATALLQKGDIDLAVVSDSGRTSIGTTSLQVMRDPFVLATPEDLDVDPAELLAGRSELAFLRFNQSHLIGQQIEAHLARNQIELPRRFEFDTAQSILAVIAGGAGWSILTPLGFMRAQRFAASVRLHPLPLPAFSRRLALVSRDSFDEALRQALGVLLRQIIRREVVNPACDTYPWLTGLLEIEE